jgi:hypothetical protein
MASVAVITGVLGVLGALLCFLSVRRLARRRILSGSVHMLAGLLFAVSALLVYGIAAHLHTYLRLTAEQPVADLHFRQLGPQHFDVTVLSADGSSAHRFELYGDEWQMDARILKWTGAGTVFGLDTLYRLERLSGRYSSIDEETSRGRSVHPLRHDDSGIDFFLLSRRFDDWLPFVDAVYGSATYLPMGDGLSYRVTISRTGLLARPLLE